MRNVLAVVVALAVAPPMAAQQTRESAAERVTELADAYMDGLFERWPELATLHGIAGADHGAITDPSKEAVSAWEAREDAWYEQLQEIDASQLDGRPEWVTYGFLREALESGRQSRLCRRELWSVDQFSGWQWRYPLLAQSIQPVGTDALRAAALRRFGALPDYIDRETANLQEGLRRGFSAPRGNVERVLDQLDGLLKAQAEESAFFGPARRDSTAAFRRAFASLIADSINPAAARYRDFLLQVYLPQARTDPAVSANPDGAACYRALIREATSLDLSPEQLHTLGLAMMDSVWAEMRAIAERSFDTDDVSGLLDRTRTDSQLLFTNGAEIQAAAKAAIERARAAIPAWFGILPRAEFVIEPIPPHEAPSAPPGYYVPPAADGSRPGVYRINLYRPEEQPRATIEWTAFHEALPGHHLQMTLALERPEAHPITRYLISTAFVEGWGLYSERLADEMGLYSSDLDRLGMLASLAFRAARLVVDTGLHALGWTRQQAIEYMLEHTLYPTVQIEAEVDRYIITPGQATAYMVGNLQIWRLRRMAAEALGEDFDVAAFHDLVLGDGAVTLPMLEQKVDRWMTAQRRRE